MLDKAWGLMHIGSDHVVGCMARFGNGLALHRTMLGPKFRVGGQGFWRGGLKHEHKLGNTNLKRTTTRNGIYKCRRAPKFITNP